MVATALCAAYLPVRGGLIALRFVPARFFGVFMSVHPVLAAVVGMALLGQFLGMHEWIGIAVVVATNAAAVVPSRRDPGTGRGRAPAVAALPAPAAAVRAA